MFQRFVDLDRYFAPATAELGFGDDSPYWGKRYGGWLRWPELLLHRRVVVLAGAGSGKTAEFQHQTRMQRQQGRAAFFVRLEELAGNSFVDAIDHQLSSDFPSWFEGDEPGWFFFDAVDELKLRGASFDGALRKISKSLGQSLERAHIVISSRPTDWHSRTDPSTLSGRLQPPEPKPSYIELDPDAALVEPVLEKRLNKTATVEKPLSFEIQTLRLASLEQDHVRQLAEANGIIPSEPFLEAIVANNLESLAQTPLDVEVLIAYWRDKSKLDRLSQMVEYVVNQKLIEREPTRPDGNLLSLEDARLGSQRIAAALTFGKALSIRFSRDDAHPTIEESSPDIESILPDWSEAKRAALLRRGVFAPATFGRVRFHHKQTQEYLTACWLDRLMRDGHGRGPVLALAFPNVHGESVVVPSLIPALSWLALRQPKVREALIERQPLALIQNGDPSSLYIVDKRKILTRYGALQRAGKVSNDMIWGRQLSLFADAGLAATIRDVWTEDCAADVRFKLVRIVGEGRIVECADLCTQVAFDPLAEDYHRIAAVRALARCGAGDQLNRLAKDLINNCASMTERLCCGFALELFPRYLTAKQLAFIIDKTPHSLKRHTDGFSDKLDEFLETCRNTQDRQALLRELVCLCRQKPYSHDYKRVSSKHKGLAEHLGPILRDAINRIAPEEVPSAVLLNALSVIQMVDDLEGRDEEQTLSQLITSNPMLNRATYWHTVIEDRVQNPDRSADHWQLLPWRSRRQLWTIGGTDWSWILADLKKARRIENRRAALVAAHRLVQQNAAPFDAVDQLRTAIGNVDKLTDALEALLSCPKQEDWEHDYTRRKQRQECKNRIREIRTERNWKTFRDRLMGNPALLDDPERVTSPAHVYDLRFLVHWLAKPKDYVPIDADLDWSRLKLPFGRAVAKAYRVGMQRLWRQAEPARPQRSDGGGVTTQWVNILAFHAVLMESREQMDWPTGLSDAEAERAVAHLVLTEQGITDELVRLATIHPEAAMRVLAPALSEECAQPYGSREILYHVARNHDALRSLLAPLVIDLVTNATAIDVFDVAFEAIRDMDLNGEVSARLENSATQRLKSACKADDTETALRSIAIMFLVNPTEATKATKAWLGKPQEFSRDLRAERFFAVLFGRDHALITKLLSTLPVSVIDQLYRLCHSAVRSEHDQERSGGPAYSPNDRDRAEEARNGFLNVIINRPGHISYKALRRFGVDRLWGANSYRAFELARERAEKDGELSIPWTPHEVTEFERKRLSPIKNGDDLMRVITEVLQDIQDGFERDDATSRCLVAMAREEDHVQNWLAERLNERAKERYHAFRESCVSDQKRTDIIVASASCDAQLVIEVKHGGKGWTVKTLESALTAQLANNYLKTLNRRHGILFVTNHTRKYWVCPKTRSHLSLDELIKRLNRVAVSHQLSHRPEIQLAAVGLNIQSPKITTVATAKARR